MITKIICRGTGRVRYRARVRKNGRKVSVVTKKNTGKAVDREVFSGP